MAWTESRELDGKTVYRGRWSATGPDGKRTKPCTAWYPYESQAQWAADQIELGLLAIPSKALEPAKPETPAEPETGWTVGAYARDWLKRHPAPEVVSHATFRAYRARIVRITEAPIRRKLIRNLTWDDVESWRLSLKGSAGTKNGYMRVLIMIYRDAHRRDLVRKLSPIERHKPFKGKTRRAWVLDRDEETALLAAADTPDLRLMMMIMIDAGLRIGEVGGLTVDSFTRPGLLEVRGAVSAVTRKLGPVKGMNQAGADEQPRRIPLSPRLAQALKPKIAEARLARGRHGLIFTSIKSDEPFSYNYWHDHFEIAKLKAFGEEGRELTGHHLRHTFASRMEAGNGTDRRLTPSQIQALLGHADLKTTQGYLTLGEDDFVAMRHVIAG